MQMISDNTLNAFEQQARSRDDALVIQWYHAQGERLPQYGEADLRKLLAYSRERAAQLGIEEDELDRLRRLMAFHALLRDPNEQKWLLGVDAVFDSPSNDSAIAAFEQIKSSGQ